LLNRVSEDPDATCIKHLSF